MGGGLHLYDVFALSMNQSRAISVGGSNSRGGAGLQADLKAFQECGVFGMGVVTAIVTLQADGQRGIFPQSVDAIEKQLTAAIEGIGTDALKTGVLYNSEIITSVASLLNRYDLPRIVVDPVILTKRGDALFRQEAIETLKKELLPFATVVTPNVPEAEMLSGLPIQTVEEMKQAAAKIYEQGPQYVLVKGGRLQGEYAVDVLYDGSQYSFFEAKRIPTIHTNGAGCTFSAIITAELAKGNSVKQAVETAKNMITAAVRHAWPLGDQGAVNPSGLRLWG